MPVMGYEVKIGFDILLNVRDSLNSKGQYRLRELRAYIEVRNGVALVFTRLLLLTVENYLDLKAP